MKDFTPQTLAMLIVSMIIIVMVKLITMRINKRINKQAAKLATLTDYCEHHFTLMQGMATALDRAHTRIEAIDQLLAPNKGYLEVVKLGDEQYKLWTKVHAVDASAYTRVDGIVTERPMCACGERKRMILCTWACEACGEATKVRAKARAKKQALMDRACKHCGWSPCMDGCGVTSEPLIKDEDLVYVETEEQLLESMSPARVGGWSRKALRCGGQTHDTQGTKPKGKKHLGGQ